jgi:sugar phosphate isomerase/epimerase
MKLAHGLHLAYCTNIHRGESWADTFAALERHTLAVRDCVSPGQPYAIGLRLGDLASRELSCPSTLGAFRRWLDAQNAYVFTINGFPYGRFHGTRVKEQVYAPDWTSPDRLAYTNRLFDILAELLPAGVDGSVSTVPVSFKAFQRDAWQLSVARANLWRCVEHIASLSSTSDRELHLGLEPEPLCVLETTEEAAAFFAAMRADRPGDDRLDQFLGINYDCCHLAIEFEEPAESIGRLRAEGVRISKLHLSNALRLQPDPAMRAALQSFADEVYLHQVVARAPDGTLRRFRDLAEALDDADRRPETEDAEWRVHFHIPLHARPSAGFSTTSDHLLGVLDQLACDPGWCRHLEMETYTWEVLPPELKGRGVVEQLVAEYAWTLARLGERGLGPAAT